MKRCIYQGHRIYLSFGSVAVLSLMLLGTAPAFGQYVDEDGLQVLTQGPMHEAFAQVAMSGPSAGIIVSRSPYAPIDEIPPEHRPEGADVAWIPGYWAWDEDRDDFIWISGVWRVIPPGREWVPGYWAPASNGMQWISGFWREINQVQVTYLPPPPEPLELGPSSPPPGPDRIWSPGCWIWRDGRYYWRPGYWIVQRPDWVWIPAHYNWTPRGCVYLPGYWDYDIGYRGVMFAPVYYRRPLYRRVGYVYRPAIVIDLGIVTAHIFIQPRTRHYYFGDYYDYRYEERGFYPWHSNRFPQYGPDPIYAHFRMRQLQQNPNWDSFVIDRFRNYRENAPMRPPRTMALQARLGGKPDAPSGAIIGRRLSEAIQSRTQPLRFTPVNTEERGRMETQGRRIRQLQDERTKTEAVRESSGNRRSALDTAKPVRGEISASPVSARASEGGRSVRTPPPAPEAPEVKVPTTSSRGAVQRERSAPTTITPPPTQRRSTTPPEWQEQEQRAPRATTRQTTTTPRSTSSTTQTAPRATTRQTTTTPRSTSSTTQTAPRATTRQTTTTPRNTSSTTQTAPRATTRQTTTTPRSTPSTTQTAPRATTRQTTTTPRSTSSTTQNRGRNTTESSRNRRR